MSYLAANDVRRVDYLEREQIIAARITEVPRKGQTQTGYGKALPTQYLVKLWDKRWHRVYVACYSNSGSGYIKTKNCPWLCTSRVDDYIRDLATGTPVTS